MSELPTTSYKGTYWKRKLEISYQVLEEYKAGSPSAMKPDPAAELA